MGTLEDMPGQSISAWIDHSGAGRALPGQRVSGDAYLVRAFAQGVLLAVSDGLGHGPDAAQASGAALEVLQEAEAGAPLAELVKRCHQALLRTRGVALSLALLDVADRSMTWTGIGNVDAVLLRANGADAALLCRGGVVGYRIPAPRVDVLTLAAGDLIVFATDGIASRFPAEIDRGAPTAVIAQTVLERCGKPVDDALVLVARWLGP